MKFEVVEPKDAKILNQIIREEFPYTAYTPEKVGFKIGSEKFFIVKAHQKNIFVGFAEAEFFEREARLNAVYVEDAWRGQKIATKLIKKIIHECKRKRIHRMFLLVKKENFAAQELYKKTGFRYEKKHDKRLDSSEVDVWAQKIH